MEYSPDFEIKKKQEKYQEQDMQLKAIELINAMLIGKL